MTPNGARPQPRGRIGRILLRLSLLLILAGLLWWVLRNVPLIEIWNAISKLKWWQILAILGMNTLIFVLITARWWFIASADNRSIRYFPMIGVRVSVFGVSYFTFGPQVGGEPLQILYLQRTHGLTYTRATSTVIMDKLLEFLANFVMLAFGLFAVIHAGIFSNTGGLPVEGIAVLTALVTWPLIHILLLYNKKYPLSYLLHSRLIPARISRAARFIRASEHLAGRCCQRHPRALLAAVFVSLLAAVGMVSEYALITLFLQVGLHFWQIAAAWTAGWLSFLIPLPGGLGALEASQVFALGTFGYSAPVAIGVVLLMRGRDLFIGGLGLLLAGHRFGR